MNKVYVLQNSWHTDDSGCDFGIVGVFSSLERAKEEMKKNIADEIACDCGLFESGEPKEGVIVDEDSTSWCAFEDGEYLLNSCEYKITEEYIYD